MIIKKYDTLFKYCYPMIQNSSEPNHDTYIKYCIYHSNKDTFTYLLTIISVDDYFKHHIMSCLLQKRANPSHDFLTFLIREQLSVLEKHNNFIYVCIQHEIDNADIMTLVIQGFPYNYGDIQLCLDKRNVTLLKYLVYHLKHE